jgi:hypothetical protein
MMDAGMLMPPLVSPMPSYGKVSGCQTRILTSMPKFDKHKKLGSTTIQKSFKNVKKYKLLDVLKVEEATNERSD